MLPIQPPFSVKLFKERVVVTVTLHKIPDQFITVDATATHFHLDTNKYSKKFLLEYAPAICCRLWTNLAFLLLIVVALRSDFVAFARFPYPEGVTVNSDKADAALDRTNHPRCYCIPPPLCQLPAPSSPVTHLIISLVFRLTFSCLQMAF